MKRWEALQRIVNRAGNALVIHANGMISRESFAHKDREENFYMVGSMGLAASIGLGIAMSRPDRHVIVIDGDGNVLMNLGTLAMVGDAQPRNFLQIVLDNEQYGSTGGQQSITNHIALEKFAIASGYCHVKRVTTKQELEKALDSTLAASGPSFVLVKVEPGNQREIGRVSLRPDKIAERFSRAIATGANTRSSR